MKAVIKTEVGNFLAHFSQTGLAALDFPGSYSTKGLSAELDVPVAGREWPQQTTAALAAVLAGKPCAKLPPLDLSGTPFQKKVWGALRRIPPGQVRTYRQIATNLGQPKAARAVGAACGANPIPVLIPCHRVVASNGKLGGFSGGLAWKRRLLALEREKAE